MIAVAIALSPLLFFYCVGTLIGMLVSEESDPKIGLAFGVIFPAACLAVLGLVVVGHGMGWW